METCRGKSALYIKQIHESNGNEYFRCIFDAESKNNTQQVSAKERQQEANEKDIKDHYSEDNVIGQSKGIYIKHFKNLFKKIIMIYIFNLDRFRPVQNHPLNLCICVVNSQRLFCSQQASVKFRIEAFWYINFL